MIEILFQDAYEAAQRYLDEHMRSTHKVEIVLAFCAEYPGAWVFGYNTRRFLADGDLMSMLVGNGPVVVPKDGGAIYLGSSASPIADQLA